MKKYNVYAKRFREIFGLPKDAETVFTRNGVWVKMSLNPLGAIELQWGVRYEGAQAQIIWNRGKPVFAEGISQYSLAVLIYFAQLMDLDTDHPYLQSCKHATDQEKIRELWQVKE